MKVFSGTLFRIHCECHLKIQKLIDTPRGDTTDFCVTFHFSYKHNMQQLSLKFNDRPMKPVDSAVWWTEYVLRHDDHSDLKPLGMRHNWCVRRSLDVWTFVAVAVFILMSIIAYLLKNLLASLRQRKFMPDKIKNHVFHIVHKFTAFNYSILSGNS